MAINRRRLFVGASAGGGFLLSRNLSVSAQDAQGANSMQPNLTTGGSVYVDQILGKARQLGVGPTGPIPAGGGLDPLTLADIIDNALNEGTPESQLLARQAGVLLSAMTTLAHEPSDKPGISEPIPASRPTDYNDMKDHYTNLCKAAKIDDTRKAEIKGIATRINNNKDRYMEVQQKTNVPWFVIGALHYREANLNFLGHLHNGDNLLMLTVDVPADRPTQRPWPPAGESLRQIWTDSAVDAMKEIPKFSGAWSMQRTCWVMEMYNGFGCFWHDINTPYLWNYTNNYTKGGYSSDNHFEPDYVSKQAGLFTTMLGIKDIGVDLGATFVLET
jgi:lysozyme family protein